MSNAELHHQLVTIYGIIEDHLRATKKIEEALGLLISLDPKLQAHIETLQPPTLLEVDRNGDTHRQTIDELLLRVHRVMGELKRQG